MSPSNKVIVEKAQNILEEYGYKVKTGHLYELFSKLSNEKSYNVAKAKNVSFADQLNLSSTENSSEAMNSKDSLSSRNLAEELRLKIPLQFKNGKSEYVITPEIFAEFRANDQMNQLKSVLAELEILGFILEPNPHANTLIIKLRSEPTKGVLNLVNSLVKESKKKENGHRAFFNDYVKELTKGTYKNKMLYGLKEDGSGYLIVDPVGEPGSYFCGGMGSGKSIAMRFSAATHMLSNNDKTFYFFVDPHKGMSDYRVLFLDENNYMRSNTVFLEEKAQIDKMIDFLYNELNERKKFFNRVSAYNIYEFHKKAK